MGITKPKEKLSMAEIEEIIEQNTRLFKNGPHFAKYITRLLLHLLERYYTPNSDVLPNSAPEQVTPVQTAPKDAAKLPTFPAPRGRQKRGRTCPQCGAPLNGEKYCPSCGVFIR